MRNEILSALAARLETGLAGKVKTVTRRMREPSSLEDMPLLVVAATTEQTNEEGSAVNPGKWSLTVGCYLWVHDAGEAGPVPAILEIVDAIEAALKAQPGEVGGYWTTLGGLVWHAALVGVDTLVDAESLDVGLSLLRIEIKAKPQR